MNTSRRLFLRNGTIAMGATILFPNEIFAAKKNNEILGLQLYTVRDDMKKDPLSTLQQLSKFGYKNVEHANYADRKFYGYPVTEFKKILDDLGLKMLSGHTVMDMSDWDSAKKDFTDKWKYTIDDAANAGQYYVISPWLDESLRKNYDDLINFLDLFNKCGELCKKSGMKFGYHNHDFEFKYSINNMKVYDIIMQHTDPELVFHQMDIGNMYGAGGRADELIKQYPGRFLSMHVKNEIKSAAAGEMNDGYESTVLNKGLLDIKHIIDLAKKSGGTSLFIIEQESFQGKTPLECSKEDLEAMKNWGY
jgi:sugar phosphate isomerase/epimerase